MEDSPQGKTPTGPIGTQDGPWVGGDDSEGNNGSIASMVKGLVIGELRNV